MTGGRKRHKLPNGRLSRFNCLLRSPRTAPTRGFPQSLKRALDWILVTADDLSAKLAAELSEPPGPDGKPRRFPLIVNASFASMAGPQDGYSDVEQRLTQFLETYRGNGPRELCNFVFRPATACNCAPWPRWTFSQRILARSNGVCCPTTRRRISWRSGFRRKAVTTSSRSKWKSLSYRRAMLPRIYSLQGLARPSNGGLGRTSPPVSTISVFRDPVVRGSALRSRSDRQPTTREGARSCRPGDGGSRIENTTDQELGIGLRVHRDDAGLFAGTGARQSYFDDPSYERFEPVPVA